MSLPVTHRQIVWSVTVVQIGFCAFGRSYKSMFATYVIRSLAIDCRVLMCIKLIMCQRQWSVEYQ